MEESELLLKRGRSLHSELVLVESGGVPPREESCMITLLILATIGALAGGMGGALTNGFEGVVLGGSAGFVLGVVAWVTETMAEHRTQALHADQLSNEFNCPNPSIYEQPAARAQPYNERSRSP